jgi:phage-related minor tail protein
MAKLGDLIVRVGADTTPLNTALGNVTKTMRRETGNIQKLGRNMSMAITAPLVAIGATSFKVAADFEQSMAKVKAVSGATGDEFKSLQDNAKELGRSTRFTASEVSALQLEYAKLGFSANEITEVTEATLNLAQATGSDLAQSAEVAGATLRAFGLDASETGRVTDVMAASFSTSALDLDSFQDSMKFVAPVAKAAGVSLEEATAMLGQLANNGIKGSTAGTSLRRILQEIAGTGQPFAEAMKKSADEVINLADAKDEVGRTASSAFLVLKEGMGDVAGLTTELQGATGAASDMAAIMDDTAEGAMKRMQSAIEGAQIEIGTALAPIMIKLAGIVADLAQKFSTMSDGGQAMVFALSAVFGAIGPVLALLPSFTAGLKAAKLAFASLNMTMRANPFGVVATAIGLVVGAVIMLNNASSEGSSKVDDLKKSLGGLDLEQQKAAIEGAATSQKAYVEQLKEERDTILKLAPYKRHANSAAGRDLKRLEKALETANADLTAMLSLEEGVALKLKATADEASGAGEAIVTLGTDTKTTTTETRKLDETLGFLFNTLEEVPNENIWKTTEDGAKDLTQTLGHLFNKLEEMPSLTEPLTQAEQDLNDFNNNVTTAVEGAAQSAAIGFGMMLGEGIATGQGMKGVGAMLLGVFADLAIQLGTLAIGYGIAIENIKIALASLAGPVAIAAGVALVALGAGLKGAIAKRAEGAGVPAFADGGIVSGPTLGLVGEYPGAKTNPEVIAPLDKLRGMLGGQSVQVTGKISGRDILLTSEMSSIDRNRVRGY